MRIAIVNSHTSDRVGGSQLQCDLIGRALGKRGHDVHYIAVAGTSNTRGVGYAIHPVPASAASIAEMCISIRPDIVYWRYNKKCFYAAARTISARDIPIVFSISHVADTQKWSSKTVLRDWNLRDVVRLIRSRVKSRWNYRGFKFVNAVVTNNADLLNRLPVVHQLRIDNSVCTDLPASDLVAAWPRPYCLWVASIKPQKQPEKFVDLAYSLESSGIDFLMIGPVRSRNCDRFRLGMRGPKNFHYLGEQDNVTVTAFLRNALFLVHTCLPEGFPNIFIQAWLQGKPVVSLCFDPEGTLASEGIGLCSGTFEQFIVDTRHLIEHPELGERMGGLARSLALSRFGLDRNVDKLEQFLYDVVDRGKRSLA